MRKDLYYNWCKWGRKTTGSLLSNPSHPKLRALVHVNEKLIKVKKLFVKKNGLGSGFKQDRSMSRVQGNHEKLAYPLQDAL